MKVTTRQDAVKRYGPIDFASRNWPQQAKWMTMLDVTDLGFTNWKVSGHPVEHIYCNVDMAEPLHNALSDVKKQGLGDLLIDYDGCFNIRMVRGTVGAVSCHSYGLAIDINAALNPLGSTTGGFYNHPDFVQCFLRQNFSWGGNFHGRKDPMHFSRAWE